MTDEGSGTVWVLVCVLVLAAAATLTATRGFVAIERQHAAAVADEAALAAASRLLDGLGAACAAAAQLTADSGAALVDCRSADADSVEVVVDVPPSGALSGLPSVRIRARAGPGAATAAQQARHAMRG